MRSRPFPCSLLTALLVLVASSRAAAQARAVNDEPPVCLGFAFGKWTPALDWRAAGHQVAIDPSLTQHAADGREWATTQAVTSEHTIVLLPGWWPAGVEVTLPNRAPALGDTVTGSAFAFVADGRRTAPTSRVRAWRVECGRHAP
jgi:hypothetical protein